MSCFYMKNTKNGETALHFPKFYTSDYQAGIGKDLVNVISLVLSTIGLGIAFVPCGWLPKYDIHNMSATQALKLALLEGIKDRIIFELYLDENGDPFITSVDSRYDKDAILDTIYYSVSHGFEKTDYCIIIKGFDPMPERIVKETIPIITNGSGPGVSVYGLGQFQYNTCGGKVFDYHGCISYSDPNLQDTTKDEMDSVFELEPFESLIGFAFTCEKPSRVDVTFSNTTQVPVEFHVGGGSETFCSTLTTTRTKIVGPEISVDVSDDYYKAAADVCNPCITLDVNALTDIYSCSSDILSVDQVIAEFSRVVNYKGMATGDDALADYSEYSARDTSACDYADIDTVVRSLSIGQDFFYKIDTDFKSVSAGIPIRKLRYSYVGDDGTPTYDYYANPSSGDVGAIRLFSGSASHVYIPFNGVVLVSIDKPSIFVTEKTSGAIGQVIDGAASVESHDIQIRRIANGITLAVTPIVTLDKPSNTAYCVGGTTTLIKMEDCLQDQDPTTEEDLEDTPCEILARESSGRVTIDLTLPFLEDDDSIKEAAAFLGKKFSDEYNNSVFVVPGNDVSARDLGKGLQGGIINKIIWTYQDKSFYKASITTGPFLSGVDSYNTSVWIRHTDQGLSREGIVMGDYGNGLEYKVYIKNLGTYTALNMTMNIIERGDAVNVTIYNNPAETFYE